MATRAKNKRSMAQGTFMFCDWSLFSNTILNVLSTFTIISLKKRESCLIYVICVLGEVGYLWYFLAILAFFFLDEVGFNAT